MSKKVVGALAVTAVVAAAAFALKKLHDEVYDYDFQEYSFDDEKEKPPVYVKTQPKPQEEFKVQDQPQEKTKAQPKTHP